MPPRRRAKAQQAEKGEDALFGNEAAPDDVKMADADAGACRDPDDVLETDLVTQLQEDLALVCEHLFVGIGSLQRDARPVPLDDEEVVGGVGTAPGTAVGTAVGTAPAEGLGDPLGLASTYNARKEDGSLDDIQTRATRMGSNLRESLRRLERHIGMLPDGIVYDTSMRMGGEGVGSAEVRGLLEENSALRERLEEVVKVKTEEVRRLEERHRNMVQEALETLGAGEPGVSPA